MPDIRLIALDLDGTVFNDDKEITPRTLAAMRAALARGVDVVPATGRAATGVPEQFLALPGVRYALTSNGASVVELAAGKALVRQPFDVALAGQVYDTVAPFGGAMSIFIAGQAYTDRFGGGEGIRFLPPALHSYMKTSRTVVDDMYAVFAAHPHDVEKFSITYPDSAVRDAAWQAVASRFDVEIACSIPNNLEINAPGVTKGSGLRTLAQTLGLTMDQVMACGDSGNDLEMLRAAGYGVAMGNATADVLAAARYVTADNNHDGVAQAIERFVLGVDTTEEGNAKGL